MTGGGWESTSCRMMVKRTFSNSPVLGRGEPRDCRFLSDDTSKQQTNRTERIRLREGRQRIKLARRYKASRDFFFSPLFLAAIAKRQALLISCTVPVSGLPSGTRREMRGKEKLKMRCGV